MFSLGRVQTPTLVMICSRYLENRNFVPAKFWQLKAHTARGGISFTVQSTAKWEQQPEAIAALQRVKDAGQPVSYTHLDVYKRQQLHQTANRERFCTLLL